MKKEDIEKLLAKEPDEWRAESQDECKVSKHHLDDACSSQGSLYMKWGGLAALSKEYYDMIEDRVKDIEAELDVAVREKPAKYGLKYDRQGNLKENAIKAAIRLNPKTRIARNKLSKARRYLKVMERAVEACEQRKTMIRMLGDLWLGEYKGGSMTIEATEEEWRERMKTRKKRH